MGLFKSIAKLAGGAIGGAIGGPVGAKIGSSLGGALAGAASSKKGAKAQTRSADAAIAEQRRQFDLTRADQQPWLQSGRNALGRLDSVATGDMSSFYTSPDYNFRRTEGQRGIQQTAAARGGAFSGNALKALSEFNSNLAAGEFGNWWDRTARQAGSGQGAAESLAVLGANKANYVGNALMSAGDARASGIIGQGNALSQGVSGALDIYDYFKNPKTPAAPRAQARNYTGSVYGSYA